MAYNAEYQRAYRETHKEKQALYMQEYAPAHREDLAKNQRVYRKAHPDTVLQKNAHYRDTHKTERLTYNRKYREENRDALLEKQRLDRIADGGARNLATIQRHRARKRGAAGANYTTVAMIQSRCEMWGDRCYICGAPKEAIDHVKPLAKGGAHLPCNLRPICTSCNSSKSDKWPYQIYGLTTQFQQVSS